MDKYWPHLIIPDNCYHCQHQLSTYEHELFECGVVPQIWLSINGILHEKETSTAEGRAQARNELWQEAASRARAVLAAQTRAALQVLAEAELGRVKQGRQVARDSGAYEGGDLFDRFFGTFLHRLWDDFREIIIE